MRSASDTRSLGHFCPTSSWQNTTVTRERDDYKEALTKFREAQKTAVARVELVTHRILGKDHVRQRGAHSQQHRRQESWQADISMGRPDANLWQTDSSQKLVVVNDWQLVEPRQHQCRLFVRTTGLSDLLVDSHLIKCATSEHGRVRNDPISSWLFFLVLTEVTVSNKLQSIWEDFFVQYKWKWLLAFHTTVRSGTMVSVGKNLSSIFSFFWFQCSSADVLFFFGIECARRNSFRDNWVDAFCVFRWVRFEHCFVVLSFQFSPRGVVASVW